MPEVEILCLANSRKFEARCIAGLLYGGGGWVRPIGTAEKGALTSMECAYSDGNEPRVLDKVRLELTRPCSEIYQPENWLAVPSTWRCLASAEPVRLSRLQRRLTTGPELLGNCLDRIEESLFSQTNPATESLTLVAPEQVSWYIRKTSQNKHQLRGNFLLKGVLYDLAVTDPIWETRCAETIQDLNTRYTTQELGYLLESNKKLLLTISLGASFKGHYYKLIAAVFSVSV